MALVYFDSSALVKLLLEEVGSDLVATVWDSCDAALSSRLAYPEVRAALAAAGRAQMLSSDEVSGAVQDWELFWQSIRPVELSADVAATAGPLAEAHHLRGADSVHLASALALGDDEIIVAVWDKRLHTAATAVGLAVVPAVLP